MTYHLVHEINGRDHAEYEFADCSVVMIGRDPSACRVAFDQSMYPMVSRHHAELRFEDGRCLVVDADSSFGTYVDDRKITAETLLRPGGRVQFGTGGPVLRLTHTLQCDPFPRNHTRV